MSLWRLGTGSGAVVIAGFLAVTLPLVGLVSLLLRSHLDPQFHNHQAHFVIFGIVGGVAFALGYAAGEAANRRGDARVLLLSLAFMATGGFMGLHAFGTAGVLFSESRAGFQIAIPVGLLVSAFFAAGSAFVDMRPELGPWLIRHRGALRGAVLFVMAAWFLWTLANVPPLSGPNQRGRDGRRARRAGDPRDDHLCGERCSVLAPVPTSAHVAFDGCHRLLPAALRGDGRRRADRGAQMARELVGVARADRPRLPDHRVRRPSRMA